MAFQRITQPLGDIEMSVSGTKRTSKSTHPMFAVGGRADIAAKLLTHDEARRIAANFAKLPELLGKP